MKIQHVHISKIKNGDVILHNGREMTVSSEYIKKGFSGITIFGDSYNCGYKLVTKISFGEGNAIRDGSGDGYANRYGSGDGDAIRDGSGKGSAYRKGSGKGSAYRFGSGEGSAYRDGIEIDEDYQK